MAEGEATVNIEEFSAPEGCFSDRCIVAKRMQGIYKEGARSWLKIKNRKYSQGSVSC